MSAAPRDGVRAMILRAVLTLAGVGLMGAVAGFLWEWWWTPPTGVFVRQQFYLDELGLAQEFSGTATYVVVGAVTGLLAGLLVSWLWRGREILALVVGTAAAGLATVIMLTVGQRLGPVDPATLAKDAAYLDPGVLDLRVVAWPAHLCVFVGMLTGMLLGWAAARRSHPSHVDSEKPRQESDADMLAP